MLWLWEQTNSATVIIHIISNCIVECQFKTAVLKTDLTDHFTIAMTLRTEKPIYQSQKGKKMYTNVTTMKRPSNHSTSKQLQEIDWKERKKMWGSW